MKHTKREMIEIVSLAAIIAALCIYGIAVSAQEAVISEPYDTEAELTQDYSAETIDPAESIISDDTAIAENTTTTELTETVEELTETVTECHQLETTCNQVETESTTESTTEVEASSDDGYIGTFLIVGYCPACNGSGGYATASGVYPQVGVTAAMNIGDMKRLGIHLGDRVYIDGFGERIIQDTGCGKGKIDLWCSCCSEEPKVTKGVWVG